MSTQKSQTFSELESLGMYSSNSSSYSLDDMIESISGNPKSDHDHSNYSQCCHHHHHHHHHNHSHGNSEDDPRPHSNDMDSRHFKSFWIMIPFLILFLLKEAILHSTGMFFPFCHCHCVGLWLLVSLFVSSFYLNSRLTNATQGVKFSISSS